ncbi:MAG: hypothetical protein QOG15_3826 [Solirubrobacteraceae bacterium]|jgi:hypothetical protein|nr:hypothetical protein [Solirubrobacteraceae bacterium]
MSKTHVAALAAVAVGIAGCGGDDNKKSSASAPTKAEFIANADPICAAAKAKSKTYTNQLDALPQSAQVKDTVPFLQGALTTTRAASVKLRALPRPTADKATLDAYFALLDRALVAGDRLLAAAKTNNLKTLQTVGAGNPKLKADRKRVAKQYGFKHCA